MVPYSYSMSIDERIEALTGRHEALPMNLELLGRDLESMRARSQQDGENIRALARIAEMHERRLTLRLEEIGELARLSSRRAQMKFRWLPILLATVSLSASPADIAGKWKVWFSGPTPQRAISARPPESRTASSW